MAKTRHMVCSSEGRNGVEVAKEDTRIHSGNSEEYKRDTKKFMITKFPNTNLEGLIPVNSSFFSYVSICLPYIPYQRKHRCASSVNGRESNALCEWSDAHV
jgi:hypothetical protein